LLFKFFWFINIFNWTYVVTLLLSSWPNKGVVMKWEDWLDYFENIIGKKLCEGWKEITIKQLSRGPMKKNLKLGPKLKGGSFT
jgi:hypothetical protein